MIILERSKTPDNDSVCVCAKTRATIKSQSMAFYGVFCSLLYIYNKFTHVSYDVSM